MKKFYPPSQNSINFQDNHYITIRAHIQSSRKKFYMFDRTKSIGFSKDEQKVEGFKKAHDNLEKMKSAEVSPKLQIPIKLILTSNSRGLKQTTIKGQWLC